MKNINTFLLFLIVLNFFGTFGLIKNSPEDPAIFNCQKRGVIALTFDDGPSNATHLVLDVLKENKVLATFFVQGDGYSNLNSPEAQKVLKRIKKEGHIIASHTWSHKSLIDLNEREIKSQMNKLSDKLYKILQFRPDMMRPPYGYYNDKVIDVVYRQLGYKMILWTIDTNDWRHPGNINESLNYYKTALQWKEPKKAPGFIALHHDPLKGSSELAAEAIKYGRMLGYRFVSLKECLEAEE